MFINSNLLVYLSACPDRQQVPRTPHFEDFLSLPSRQTESNAYTPSSQVFSYCQHSQTDRHRVCRDAPCDNSNTIDIKRLFRTRTRISVASSTHAVTSGGCSSRSSTPCGATGLASCFARCTLYFICTSWSLRIASDT